MLGNHHCVWAVSLEGILVLWGGPKGVVRAPRSCCVSINCEKIKISEEQASGTVQSNTVNNYQEHHKYFLWENSRFTLRLPNQDTLVT